MSVRGHVLLPFALALGLVAAAGCEQDDLVVARIQPLDDGASGAGAAGSGQAGTSSAGTSGAASGGTAGQAGGQAEACELPPWHNDLNYLKINDCRVPESYRATLERLHEWLMSVQPQPSAGEARPPEPCDFWRGGAFFYEDPEDPETFVLCAQFCDAAIEQADRENHAYQECKNRSAAAP